VYFLKKQLFFQPPNPSPFFENHFFPEFIHLQAFFYWGKLGKINYFKGNFFLKVFNKLIRVGF